MSITRTQGGTQREIGPSALARMRSIGKPRSAKPATRCHHHAFGSAAFQGRQEERESPCPLREPLSGLLNPGEHVRPQPWTRIEDGYSDGCSRSDRASNRRRQRQPTHVHSARGEELAYARNRNAAHIRVARIVLREVVPEHAAARTHPSPHPIGEPLLKRIIEQ